MILKFEDVGREKMKRLIFFTGVYDTLDLFVYELKREFERMKYDTMIFDVRQMSNSLRELTEFIKFPIEAVITFNNLGFNMELSPGKNIWEELKIPCINILMDHPFCYHEALKSAPHNAVVFCTDRNHMNYVKRFYPNIPITGYLPHAGKEAEAIYKPINERKIDVLYAGGLSKTFAENIMPDFSKYIEFDAKNLCKVVYQTLIANPGKTTECAFEETLNEMGIHYGERELSQVIADLHFVDLYAVSYFREKTLRVLAESGIQIELFGAGWGDCSWISCSNVHYRGRIAAEEIIKKMQDAKVVLNTMTWFKDGTHDRVFNGMLQGAVIVSDTSIYMEEEFCGFQNKIGEDNRELVFFDLQDISSLPEKVKGLLQNSASTQKIADRGFWKAKEKHTWRNRATDIKTELLDNRELMEWLHC